MLFINANYIPSIQSDKMYWNLLMKTKIKLEPITVKKYTMREGLQNVAQR